MAFTLVPGFKYSPSTDYWSIWVDYNEDNVFQDYEKVYTNSSTGTLTSSFTIPSATKTGYKRLRIMMKHGSAITSPCENYTDGVVEDLLLSIVGTSLKSAAESEVSSINNSDNMNENIVAFPNPVNDILNISFSILKPEDNVNAYLYDLKGSEVKIILNRIKYISGQYQVISDLSSLSSGIYVLKIDIGNNSYNEKVIKK